MGILRTPPLLLVATLLSGAGILSARQPANPTEYQIKAAFLYNFAKFVDWPARAFAGSPRLNVCIVGQDPFGPVLDDLLADEVLDGRPIRVRRIALEGVAAEACHILFLPNVERSRTKDILSAVASRPVLTVGEADGFIGDGGVVNFYVETGRVRFEVNLDAAQRAGLSISSKMLRVARVHR